MASRPASVPVLPLVPSSPVPVVAGALLAAFLVGFLLARGFPLGVGLLIGLCYVPLVLINLPLGLALLVMIFFVERLPFVSIGPNAAGILVGLAWIGTLASPRARKLAVLRQHRGMLMALSAFLIWISLSLVWSKDPSTGGAELWRWYIGGLLLLIVATTISTPRHVRWITAAFVGGAVVSVLLGGALEASGALVADPENEGRLTGGYGDPNDLAAVLLPAILLAGGLVWGTRKPLRISAATLAIAVLVFALVATESRGGLLAGGAAVCAGLLLARERRRQIAALVAVAVGLAAAGFATAPTAWERVTSFEDRGNGRSDLWTVAWHMALDHPVGGVGINNFPVRSGDYALAVGPLEFAEFLTDEPKVVHNLFLELLAETGIVGLVLFLTVAVACLRAAWLAGRSFDARGDPSLATLSGVVLTAGIGMLAAAVFISNGTDKPLWLLLGLGPALLKLARSVTPTPPSESRSRPPDRAEAEPPPAAPT